MEDVDLIRADFDHFLSRLYALENDAKTGKVDIDLVSLSAQIDQTCAKIDNLPPEQARLFTSRMNEMIECLNRLETEIKKRQD
ncbi:MAG: hypothetical protein CMP22_02975 [Rickettsiales bacterium]|nr:hypothetical protein [Rickettsiales bacterium]|tara:strand:- start:21 stop:269 length:249 start_codon:yes stop_codon:yes gene_type:complete